jgi:hypothetical protein
MGEATEEMRIGCFITITNPEERGDTHKECIAMANDLFDEVTIIDGKDTWPQEFSWPLIGEHFQRGYEQCNADFVVHLDTDFIFHQKDFGKIRQALRDYPNAPAVSFYKWQFILPDRYNLKARLVIAVNKKKFGDRIKFDSGGDLCQPSLDGKELDLAEVPQAGVPFWNYEKLTKTKEQIIDDVERMDDAYLKRFGFTLYSSDELTAYEGWLQMACGRFNKPSAKIPLEAHPKYIQETIRNLKPEQWGYDGLGNLERNSYA